MKRFLVRAAAVASLAGGAAADVLPYGKEAADLAASLTGTWSFDGSCASGDGMGLTPDGEAFFGEGGDGLWGVTADGRLILTLHFFEMGEERPKNPGLATIYEFRVAPTPEGKLKMQLVPDGERVEATKCPPP